MDEDDVKRKMEGALSLFSTDISSIRTGKASPGIVSDIVISAYGGSQRLKVMELASVITSDPTTIVIDPWDKSVIGEIRKGIEMANVGISPMIDGEIVRINIPPMTTEDREKYSKLLSLKIENAKIMLRQVRSDAMKSIKGSFEKKEISEDENFALEKKLQQITDSYTQKLEGIGEKKRNDLIRV